jgi:hypothetical protein
LNSNDFSLLKNKERFKELKLSILRPEMRRIQDVGFSGSLVRY